MFESSARLAILAKHMPQLLSSLSGLVPGLYRAVDQDRKGKAKASTAIRETSNMISLMVGLALDAPSQPTSSRIADSRAEFARLLLLFHLVQNGQAAFFETYLDLTLSRSISLRSPLADISTDEQTPQRRSEATRTPADPSFLKAAELYLPLQVARLISLERFSPIGFFALLRDRRISPCERAILSWASESVRERAWVVLKKGYMEVSVEWAGRWLGLMGDELREWVEKQGCRIDGDRIKLR